MKEWILICNTNYYDIKAAFDTNEYLTWPQISNASVGDTVYCYVTNPYRAVLYSCVVSEMGLIHMDDASKEYVKHALFYDNKQEYMRLKLTTRYPETLYTDTLLKENGIESLQMTTLVPDKLSKFFHNNKRKTKKLPMIILAGLIALGAIGTGLYSWSQKTNMETTTAKEKTTSTSGKTTKESSDSKKTKEAKSDKKNSDSYKVTIINGTGTGDYHVGDVVSVKADEIENKTFTRWKVVEGDISFLVREPFYGMLELISASDEIEFDMPKGDVTIEALYTDRCATIDEEVNSGEIRSKVGNCYYGYTDSSNNGSGFVAVYTDKAGNILGCLKLYYQITKVDGDDNYGAIMIAYSDKDCEIDSTVDASIFDGEKTLAAQRYSWENGKIILDIGKKSDNTLIVRDPDFEAVFKTKSISTDKYIDMHENIIALNWTSNLSEVGEYGNYLLNNYHDDPDQIEVTKEMAIKVQTRLNELGYECGTADGVIGSKSQKAIENFQKDNGINSTGTITQDLLDKLGI